MASLKRSKTMPADGQTAKFLYTILKQLDLKSIDWNLVASQLEISNGHAARMRYSRFRQHMEGTTSTPRAQRPGAKKAKTDKAQAKQKMFANEPVKPEPDETAIKPEPLIKKEAMSDIPLATSSATPMTSPSAASERETMRTVSPADLTLPHQHVQPPVVFSNLPTPAEWSRVKVERSEEVEMQDVVVKTEPRCAD